MRLFFCQSRFLCVFCQLKQFEFQDSCVWFCLLKQMKFHNVRESDRAGLGSISSPPRTALAPDRDASGRRVATLHKGRSWPRCIAPLFRRPPHSEARSTAKSVRGAAARRGGRTGPEEPPAFFFAPSGAGSTLLPLSHFGLTFGPAHPRCRNVSLARPTLELAP